MPADVFVDAAFNTYAVFPIKVTGDCGSMTNTQLLDSSGEPIANRSVRISNSDGTSYLVSTNANGYYRTF